MPSNITKLSRREYFADTEDNVYKKLISKEMTVTLYSADACDSCFEEQFPPIPNIQVEYFDHMDPVKINSGNGIYLYQWWVTYRYWNDSLNNNI